MPPVTPTELAVLALLAATLLLVPSVLAFALFSLSRADRDLAAPPVRPAARRSPRRVPFRATPAGRPDRRHGPVNPRRFGSQ